MRNYICLNHRDCFGKLGGYRCTVLKEPINDHPCPFAKKRREFTNGVYYPFSPLYSNKKEDE